MIWAQPQIFHEFDGEDGNEVSDFIKATHDLHLWLIQSGYSLPSQGVLG